MTIKSKLATGLASAALLANLAAPAAFADTTVEVSGNGAKSDNEISYTSDNDVAITQTNTAVINLNISSNANTGGNNASGNTGGDTTINTGDATSMVGVLVEGGLNAASVGPSCDCDGNTTVNVKNNGKKTNNKTTVKKNANKTGTQNSSSVVNGDVKSNAKTGKNKAKNNTNGSVDVKTGTSLSETAVEVTSQANVLEL